MSKTIWGSSTSASLWKRREAEEENNKAWDYSLEALGTLGFIARSTVIDERSLLSQPTRRNTLTVMLG